MDEPAETILKRLQDAANLLLIVWESIPTAHKSQYRREIWSQFQSNVTAVAQRVTTISRFISQLCSTFPNTVLSEENSRMLMPYLALNIAEQERLLDLIRTDTASVIAVLRAQNAERRAAFQLPIEEQ